MAGANPMRGEAPFGERKLVVDFNNWCVAESAMNATVSEILGMMARQELGCRGLRTLVRAFLDVDMPVEAVGDLIAAIGMDAAADALTTAMDGFFPPKGRKKANPPKAE